MLGPQMTRKRCEILQSRLLEGGVGECEVIPKGACSQGCAMPSLTHVVVATPPAGGGVSASIARFLGMPQHDVAKSFAQHSDGEQEGDSNSEGAPSLVNVEWVMRIIKEQKFISEDEFEVHLDGTHACEHAVSAQSDSSPPAVDSRSAVSGAPASECEKSTRPARTLVCPHALLDCTGPQAIVVLCTAHIQMVEARPFTLRQESGRRPLHTFSKPRLPRKPATWS
eukprot:GHVU01047270.1.p1 GENE.GHVU01047270.1~~GHVU01047270.1.p1  ORF type:complete len:225 (+),score=15.36 GHVU01047270.1:189-863(+)